MTVSHRLGTAEFTKLTEKVLQSFKLGISIEWLPKTFRDAVAIARWLDVHYLWIDSLCIIQGSEVDWSKEAGLMSDVYQHAFCNIAATGARNSNGGLFFDRYANPFSQSNYRIVPTDDPKKSFVLLRLWIPAFGGIASRRRP